LIQSSTATLYVDDGHLLVDRFGATDGVIPFSFEGRTADGRISLTGSVPGPGAATGLRTTIYLENVGAAAVGRLTPNARLVPASGPVTGRVQLVVQPDAIDCQSDVVLKNVTYVVNAYAPFAYSGTRTLQERLAGFVVNGPAQATCTGKTGDPDYRLANVVQASVTNQAVKHAAPEIKAAAAADVVQSHGSVKDAAVSAGVDALASEIGKKVGIAPPVNGANPVTKGVKKVGSGLKRLFGGDKPKKKGPG